METELLALRPDKTDHYRLSFLLNGTLCESVVIYRLRQWQKVLDISEEKLYELANLTEE